MKLVINRKNKLFGNRGEVEQKFDWNKFESDPFGYLTSLDAVSRSVFIVIAGIHYRGQGGKIREFLEKLESVK